MPRSKEKPAGAAFPASHPSKTAHLFAPRKAKDRAPVTHEQIAEDLETFRKAGGEIEVLGTTRCLTKIDPDGDASPPVRPTHPMQAKPGR